MNLRYKTRGNSTPNRKPKVFFCCHPLDFTLFFDEICKDIFAFENCAIYYFEDDAVSDEDRRAVLSEMQLFVMPITTRLLTTENVGMSDFAFAIENHIPVLPLMQEPDLDKLFNKRCGDLQFLDKYKIDETAISYGEKLKKYLNSVLIGDELAEQVRAAFDAYIFLSYRKKDRKYAQELMRIIHKNEFCRDIAIWYDEFLTPGENFNAAIKLALEKSNLFVLAVTPNLVNEVNYIMTTEYPAAINEKKAVLPIEMVETDKDKLSECYPQIPKCVVGRDETELSARLLKNLQAAAKEEVDCTPQHTFFIGLAYLAGIDVEIDYARAVKLIGNSAEAGLPAAVKKLADMYRNGEGVACDYDKAIAWCKKLCEIRLRDFNSVGDSENRKNLIDALCDLVDLLSFVGNRPVELRHACLQIAKYSLGQKEFAEQLAFSFTQCGADTNDEDLKYGAVFGDGFDMLLPEEKERVQRDFYMSALNVYETAYSDKTYGDIKRANIYLKLSMNAFLLDADDDKAKTYAEKALRLAEKTYNDTDNSAAHSIMAQCYVQLALLEYDNFDAQMDNSKNALEIFEMIAEQSGSVSDWLFVAKTHKQMGDYLIDALREDSAVGGTDRAKLEATEHYRQAYKIYDEIASKRDIPKIFVELISICQAVKEYSPDENERKLYCELYKKHSGLFLKSLSSSLMGNAEIDFEQYADKMADIFAAQIEIAANLSKGIADASSGGKTVLPAADVRQDGKRIEENKKSLKKQQQERFDELCGLYADNLHILEEIADYFKTAEACELLLYEYKCYFWLLFLNGEYGEVLKCGERMESFIKSVADAEIIRNLYGILADIFSFYPDINGAYDVNMYPFIRMDKKKALDCCFECYKRAVRLRKEIRDICDTDAARRDLDKLYVDVAKYSDVVQITPDCGVSNKTEELFGKAELAAACERLGDYNKAQESYSEAKDCYERAVCVTEKTVQDDDTVESLLTLARLYKKAGHISKLCAMEVKENKEDYRQTMSVAKRYYKQAMIVRKTIYEHTYDDIDYLNLSESCYDYGKITKNREMLEDALFIASNLSEKYPDNQKYAKIKYQVAEYIKKRFDT